MISPGTDLRERKSASDRYGDGAGGRDCAGAELPIGVGAPAVSRARRS
jgi:hypothetical protein